MLDVIVNLEKTKKTHVILLTVDTDLSSPRMWHVNPSVKPTTAIIVVNQEEEIIAARNHT